MSPEKNPEYAEYDRIYAYTHHIVLTLACQGCTLILVSKPIPSEARTFYRNMALILSHLGTCGEPTDIGVANIKRWLHEWPTGSRTYAVAVYKLTGCALSPLEIDRILGR